MLYTFLVTFYVYMKLLVVCCSCNSVSKEKEAVRDTNWTAIKFSIASSWPGNENLNIYNFNLESL